MHILAAVLALVLLVIALFPIIRSRLRASRRVRAVHLDGSCHWYANYDENLRYEPHSGGDIVRLAREDVMLRGYHPTQDVQIVPRTFRRRVPGDVKIRLWKNDAEGSPPLWLCEWAMSPIRVAIGVGEREKVPGVESGRIPVQQEEAGPLRTLEEEAWPLVSLADASADSELPTDDTAGRWDEATSGSAEVPASAVATDLSVDFAGSASAERAVSVDAGSLEVAGAEFSGRTEGEIPGGSGEVVLATSAEEVAEGTAGAFPAMPGDEPAPRRSKRRHRRRL